MRVGVGNGMARARTLEPRVTKTETLVLEFTGGQVGDSQKVGTLRGYGDLFRLAAPARGKGKSRKAAPRRTAKAKRKAHGARRR